MSEICHKFLYFALHELSSANVLVLQADRGRLSGSWDHKSPLPAPSPPPANGTSASSRAMPSRLMSTPYPEKKGSSMSVKPRPERTRQPSKDDSELTLRSSGKQPACKEHSFILPRNRSCRTGSAFLRITSCEVTTKARSYAHCALRQYLSICESQSGLLRVEQLSLRS